MSERDKFMETATWIGLIMIILASAGVLFAIGLGWWFMARHMPWWQFGLMFMGVVGMATGVSARRDRKRKAARR